MHWQIFYAKLCPIRLLSNMLTLKLGIKLAICVTMSNGIGVCYLIYDILKFTYHKHIGYFITATSHILLHDLDIQDSIAIPSTYEEIYQMKNKK